MIYALIILLSSLFYHNSYAIDSYDAKEQRDIFAIATHLINGRGLQYGNLPIIKKRHRFFSYSNDGCCTSQRAIIVGASVGMGKELAKLLAADGYIVGMTSR